MYIKHIILEGFKSYKERTDIGPFDPHFNAITGLNGSGKSNILDSICFVLGLSSLQLVRAGNLGDLIYKGGTGGVTRASASIVFDNRDKTHGKCPVGYEKFNEIIVSRTVEATGTCKYYLNSITSTKKQITDLFESVQLNITNPNFMIQQGKITKVIGMTPKQVLMMIEESVGGNAYQSRRDKVEQELINKERCLATIRGLIDETIYPEYAKQRRARDLLNEFQSVEQQRLKASKFYALIAYQELNEGLRVGKKELDKILSKDDQDDDEIKDCKSEIESSKQRQQQMKKENTDKFKDKIENAEKALATEKKSHMTKEAKLNSAKMDVDDAQKQVVEADKAKQQQEKEMLDYKKKSANAVAEFEAVKADIANAQDQLSKAKEQENALKMGNIVDEEGNTCDARQELMRVETEIHKIEPDFQVGEQEFKEDQQKLKSMEQELKKTPSDDQVERDYNVKFQKAEQLKKEAVRRQINPDDNAHEIIRTVNESKQRIDQLEREKQKIWSQNFGLSFNYNKNNVDSSKIHGCLYELLKFNGIEEWGGGLEVLSGGFASHVVIDDQQVGKALLQRGELPRRTTLHPLSVFRTQNNSRVTQQQLDNRLGPGKAVPAIDLIECNPIYRDIVQHFFGGKVICDTLETAKKVAYEMKFWAVSKIGDVADPGGTMQGGTRRNLGATIRNCEILRVICAELKHLHEKINDLQHRLQTAKANEEFMKTLEIAKRDLHNAEETRKLTKYSMLQQEVNTLKQKLQQASEKLKEWKQQLDKYEKERKGWKTKVDQIENLREKNKKDNAALISKWEKALANATKKYEAKQKQFGDIDVEIQSREALIADCQKDIEAALTEKAEYEKVHQKLKNEFDEIKRKFQEKQDAYDAAVAESQQWNAEFNDIEEAIREFNNRIHKIDLDKMKRANTRTKLQATVDDSSVELKRLIASHKTVNFEKEEIPPEERRSLTKLKHELATLNKQHEELSLRIDHDANERYEGTKAALGDAESKLKKVEGNRNELQKVINTLDKHKMSIVLEAYDKVNYEFNKMMGTLLPDSAARLVPVNIDDLNQGLNIHVQLGGVWKESLSELSGGQRSLVALALVLSLCMYNAAPFYVLDEIDSALDLNHTQNIGVLIKRKFTGTQFVCVSLKDGMYSNCNILFQVQFINGRSQVKRCVRQSSRKNDEEAETSRNKSKEKAGRAKALT